MEVHQEKSALEIHVYTCGLFASQPNMCGTNNEDVDTDTKSIQKHNTSPSSVHKHGCILAWMIQVYSARIHALESRLWITLAINIIHAR